MKRKLSLIASLTTLVVMFACGSVAQSTPPQKIEFTEVQRLKAEVLQLRLAEADRQLKEVQTQYVALLKDILAGARVKEDDYKFYQLDEKKFVFARVEPTPTPAPSAPGKK